MSKILWNPSINAIVNSQLSEFMNKINSCYELRINDYKALHEWSIHKPEAFWQAVWEFCQLEANATKGPSKIIERGTSIENTRWFVDARLNFAQNLLRFRDNEPALVFSSERGDREIMTYAQLCAQVAALTHTLKKLGIGAGDRVVGVLPNSPHAVIAMLATTSLGGVWSACSSDFGIEGLIQRFSQISPKVLFSVDGHYYAGKTFNHLAKISALQQKLPSLSHTILVPWIANQPDTNSLTNTTLWDQCIFSNAIPTELEFTQLPFDHPLYILYSSGTTGKPKCMVHGAGNTLIQHLKELMLHTDLQRSDHFFFYTTCTWMMWHWLVSGLAVGATIILYEGSPAHPHLNQLFDLIDNEQISIFGVGAKLLESAQHSGLIPRKSHSLASLRTILTTGSPLLPESFDYVYQSIKREVQLSSISGGSDIISLFAAPNPMLPVYRGELQCIGLGMDVKIFNSKGEAIINEPGELVCTSPFPSMPIYFWNDPEHKLYHNAYFTTFANTWTQGDYALETDHGSLIIYGRSDTTLKPSGVRIGTAEIYQEIDSFPQIKDCLAVGKQTDTGEIIILFVVLKGEQKLTTELSKQIKQRIRENASPMHVPTEIYQAPDLPKTINAKNMEMVVKKIINGQAPDNLETVSNPECLEFFRQFAN